MAQKTIYDSVLEMARTHALLRIADVQAEGIHPEYVRRLYRRGKLQRIARGIYALPEQEITQHHSYALAAKSVPHGVVCLLSALRFHGITTESPFELWMAIGQKSWQPTTTSHIPLRFVRYSRERFIEGVEEHSIERVPVRIYSPAKTVADCFAFRNKIGLDVALQALKECLQERKIAAEELWHYAKICRVSNVMRPYMEAMII